MCIQIVANERSASIRALFHRHDYFVYLCMYVLYMKLASALRYTNNLRERCKFNIFTFVFHSIIIVLLKTMIYHNFCMPWKLSSIQASGCVTNLHLYWYLMIFLSQQENLSDIRSHVIYFNENKFNPFATANFFIIFFPLEILKHFFYNDIIFTLTIQCYNSNATIKALKPLTVKSACDLLHAKNKIHTIDITKAHATCNLRIISKHLSCDSAN